MCGPVTDVITSPVWHIINDAGEYWHCPGHMCMSPMWQKSWDERIVCNGCLGTYNGPALPNLVEVVSCTVQVTENDIARVLREEEVGYSG